MITYSNPFKLTRKNIHYEESDKINQTHSCFCVFLSVCYVLVLWAYAQFAAPGEGGNVETVSLNGKVVGVANVGQRFTQDIYFGDDLPVPVTVTTEPARPAATKG